MSLNYPIYRYRLGNGLDVVVSPDRAAPIAAVALAYRVGSRDEGPGQAGLAHLFEHLMGGAGSRDVAPGEQVRLVQVHGGGCNAAALADVTVFYQQVPVGALELMLWVEANRMGTLGEALTQSKLDIQRDVVRQEGQQRFGQPFGTAFEKSLCALFPAGHPYRSYAQASPPGLDSLTLTDVCGFFGDYYRPNNAVLAVVGDVEPDAVFATIEGYFGQIPAGALPAVRRGAGGLEPLGSPVREDVAEPRAGFAMVHSAFRLPHNSVTDTEIYACAIALRILADGPASRLHRRLAQIEKIAQQTEALIDPRAGTSIGTLAVVANPGVAAAAVEQVIGEELQLLADKGPQERELNRERAHFERETLAGLATALERAFDLATFTISFEDPDAINTFIDRIYRVDAESVQQAADRWLRPTHQASIVYHPAAITPPAPTA